MKIETDTLFCPGESDSQQPKYRVTVLGKWSFLLKSHAGMMILTKICGLKNVFPHWTLTQNSKKSTKIHGFSQNLHIFKSKTNCRFYGFSLDSVVSELKIGRNPRILKSWLHEV